MSDIDWPNPIVLSTGRVIPIRGHVNPEFGGMPVYGGEGVLTEDEQRELERIVKRLVEI